MKRRKPSICPRCGQRVKTGTGHTARGFCDACFDRLESRDTGWQILPTRHGPRFHREIGIGLALDVEQGAGLAWVASAVRDRQLVGVRVGLPSAASAAEAIEALAKAEPRQLPRYEESDYAPL